MSERKNLLIVDDEPNIRSGISRGLRGEVDEIVEAADVNQALDQLDSKAFQVMIADVRLPGDRDGLDLVKIATENYPDLTSIVITAYGTVETAVEAMRRGAFDFITKPVDLNLIRKQVARAFEHGRLRTENFDLKKQLADAGSIAGIIGESPGMKAVEQQVRQVAETDATVMIFGESGTGKELVARALHDLSPRCKGPFVATNLAALPESLLESEMFGHEKGAFTDASRQKQGCFERAGGGTLFLDEVTEIMPKCQVDLLRVLETGEYARVGGERLLHADVRIVSATNRPVSTLMDADDFREDLFYRLNIVPIELPPLRDRIDDIPLLADHFLTYFCQRHHRPPKTLSDAAVEKLISFRWPGNVRQLRNMMERVAVIATDQTLQPEHLPAERLGVRDAPPDETLTLAEATEAAERRAIESALRRVDFHREKAAQVLGVSVRTLHYKMSKYGMHAH